MIHSIGNDKIRLSVSEHGAEMSSLFDVPNNIEHLWQADEKYWPWHAPVLFPVVGRCLNDQIEVDGVKYKMERHGFARRSEFQLIDQGPESLRFRLSSSPATLAIYPYQFDFDISYQLYDGSLTLTYEVVNKGNTDMYFQLGGHPAFAVPFYPGEQYEDYYLEFDRDTILDRENINSEGYFDTSVSHVLNGTNILPLERDMFYKDAIIFKDINSRKVTLRSRQNPHTLSVEFPDFEYLGLWAKGGGPFICIEPWRGCADTAGMPVSMKYKEGAIGLAPDDKFQASIIVTIS